MKMRPPSHLVPFALISIIKYLAVLVPTHGLKLSSLGSFFFDEPNSRGRSDDVHIDDTDVCSIASCSSYTYGVDTSFPIHHHDVQEYHNPLNAGVKRQLYNDFMNGCRSRYSSKPLECNLNERDRIEMNLNQPRSMFNYTKIGFDKIRAPAKLMNILAKFWKDNASRDTIKSLQNEEWPVGNTYTNHWTSPTKMLNLQNSSLIGSDATLRSKIYDETKLILQQWAGVELSPSSLYGVRIYTSGAVLASHVDRNPLVISAIINVAQNVQEDWPLEAIGHDGQAYNITMEVGDMILYESHSVIHGRPFPLNGDYFANVFVHFEPLGYSLREGQHISNDDEDSLESLYQEAWESQKRQQAKICRTNKACLEGGQVDLNAVEQTPYYIDPESKEGKRWMQSHPRARLTETIHKSSKPKPNLTAHAAAAQGDLESLMILAAKDRNSIRTVDANGWNPLHEAARSGHVQVVSYLLSKGLDINERTGHGKGGTPLWWAKKEHGDNHPIVRYLENNGAIDTPPE